jgi:hypothetical protein
LVPSEIIASVNNNILNMNFMRVRQWLTCVVRTANNTVNSMIRSH